MVPNDYKYANKGVITEVKPDGFVLELDYQSDGILKNNYCEFYTQTENGTLYFKSYPKEIDKNILFVSSPAKHKFLQRRQYTRIKFNIDLDMNFDGKDYKVKTMDISAGGMKFVTNENINIELQHKKSKNRC